MLKVTIIAGARPNFMKIAPIIHEINRVKSLGNDIDFRLVHTGQHYDKNMSGSFFEQLEIPEPHVNLESSGGTQAEQTASIMVSFEKELQNFPADLVLVVGDVTSTMACAIVAQKLHTKVAHVEAGIRSGDWTMPEEINRLVTDSITNYFFTTSKLANDNLKNSGVSDDKIFYVGNTMIDTLLKQRSNFIKPQIWDELGLENKKYIVMTLHRPANVDEEFVLKELMQEIIDNSKDYPLIFPVHPRTAKILDRLGINHSRLYNVPPLSYLEFNYLVERAKAVITDSGGITEETSIMRVPCLTLRDNTERPETLTLGTNELVGTNPKNIKPYLDKLFNNEWKTGNDIPLWDGDTSKRIVKSILNLF
ncbi:UDP-N-acetylglucosamine 2-epimerase (non-hydrolyzing) [Ichthyenterobacterium sp. W332]|uniref:UDP-N-acetylglucosamine 2-epimerase (Non-hydrolyzing) n=1 Tax=Microcosmobacter mediterraneus TaxID=3075607 RepID=A0ABU2YQ30_9FLAO|nr:UDP-N-acetylglucosamine 2-epimerase (non-hydrolyzing) [Ichthyenterobacterium sp. W332]MDT0559375.1 UDP-N-acetylglucosamine 2-epimerase (non-hydrolyzing) [Ichthyenterobacterium sp. W332]